MFQQYTFEQKNGQRIYGGPPPDWKGSYPAKGSEIFVGKVPHDIFEDELVPIFEQVCKTEALLEVLRLLFTIEVSGNTKFLFLRLVKSTNFVS